MDSHNYLIIGGTSGIGLAIVEILREEGHQLYVTARNRGELPEDSAVHFFAHDITEPQFPIEKLADSLQGLVYCPGTIQLKPFMRLQEDDYLEDFRVNFLGATAAIRSCLPLLRKSSTGASIVMFSTVAVTVGMPFHASVACAKGAIEGLTRSLAAEFAPQIRVNAIAPSMTDTRLAQPFLNTEQKSELAKARHPLKRVGAPDDIAAMAVFLLMQKSSWITGQILHVDGGISGVQLFK